MCAASPGGWCVHRAPRYSYTYNYTNMKYECVNVVCCGPVEGLAVSAAVWREREGKKRKKCVHVRGLRKLRYAHSVLASCLVSTFLYKEWREREK